MFNFFLCNFSLTYIRYSKLTNIHGTKQNDLVKIQLQIFNIVWKIKPTDHIMKQNMNFIWTTILWRYKFFYNVDATYTYIFLCFRRSPCQWYMVLVQSGRLQTNEDVSSDSYWEVSHLKLAKNEIILIGKFYSKNSVDKPFRYQSNTRHTTGDIIVTFGIWKFVIQTTSGEEKKIGDGAHDL